MTVVARTRMDLADALHGLPRPLHLVPTMGALHEGHAALLRAARAASRSLVMSLFVNPLQFNDKIDLERYPRTLEGDVTVAGRCGVDVVWAPTEAEMYLGGRPLSLVQVASVSEPLEGSYRPGHFDGVATVVLKLFHQVGPNAAWFGKKDAQQLAVIRRMASDLDFPIEILAHPTVRDADGLALSSRNSYLDARARRDALRLSSGLFAAAELAVSGERRASVLEAACGADLEYAALVDAGTFSRLEILSGQSVLAVAARVGPARLIDNVFLELGPDGKCVVDLGMTLIPTEKR